MQEPNKFGDVLVISCVATLLCYASVASMGYALCGSRVTDDLLTSFNSETFQTIGLWVVAVNPLLRFAIMIFPIVSAIDDENSDLVDPNQHDDSSISDSAYAAIPVKLDAERVQPEGNPSEKTLHHKPPFSSRCYKGFIGTSFLMVCVLAIAIKLPKFGLVTSVIGSALTNLLVIVIPCACHYATVKALGSRALDLVVGLFAFCLTIAGTVWAVKDLVSSFQDGR